jgi:hypothetical protein
MRASDRELMCRIVGSFGCSAVISALDGEIGVPGFRSNDSRASAKLSTNKVIARSAENSLQE